MNITITDPKATESHQNFYLILSKQLGNKSKLRLLIYLGVGLLLIIYDLLNFNDCTFKFNTGLLKGKFLSNEMECINLHLSLGIGIGFCILWFTLLTIINRIKEENSLENWKSYKTLHGNSNNKTSIIDDTGILIFGESFRFEYKWGLPKHFFRVDNYIAVYDENYSLLCCVINVNQIADDSKTELISFLEKNLKEENIKQLKKHLK